jgi:predicted NBD/HSP70 family sugar kinase
VARTSRDIRSANRLGVVQQVIAAGTTSRQRIAADTGLSLATVATLVGELTALGLLAEAGREDSGGGRPRGLVTPNSGGGLLIGVDVAETYVHVDLFDATLTRLTGTEEALHPSERRPEQVVAHIVSGVRAVMAGPGARILGVGVSVPGQVDREGGVSVFAPNWDWHDVPLRDLLSRSIEPPLHLDNPLRAAVVAELWSGAARGRDDVAVINLGTGVGAGLAFGGTLYRGTSNTAGEWGHTTLVLDGRLCRCGSRGCVEAYVGAPGIMQTLRDLAPTSALLHPEDQTATLGALAAGLAAGDPIAAKVNAETGRYLGVAVADLINLINPELVVLSSWVAERLGPPLLDEVRAVVTQHALRRPLTDTEIVLSTVRGNPVSLGAATLALEGFLTGGR